MRLEKLAKDEDSGVTGCPAVYLDEGGWFTIQAAAVDANTFGNLENVLAGEAAVRIKPEVIIEAVRRYQAR